MFHGIRSLSLPGLIRSLSKPGVYRGEQRHVVGSGLGLAIAKRAVERAGGSISMESERGVETKVTIALPCQPHAIADI
jgi:signal transduction histidine kinase